MSFDSTTIGLSINGNTPVATWRQDAAAGNSIVASLSSAVGVNTYSWQLVGRPEGSTAGGTGPEPISLGTATTCAFTVDIPGTYIVSCLLNGGAPDATIITAGIAILETVLSPDNLPLRLLGPGETSQDIAEPLVAQGWLKMLNRWLKLVATQGASGTSDHLVIVAPGKTADTLSARLISSDGTVIFTVNGNQLDLSASASSNPAGLYYLKTGSGSSPPTQLVKPPHINAGGNWTAALTSSYAAIATPATPTGVLGQGNLNDPYLSVLPAGQYRLRLWCESTAAANIYFTIASNGSVVATGVSSPVAIPSGGGLVKYDLYATAAVDTVLADPTLPLILTVYAKANVGTATLTVGGAGANNATLSCPWCGNHSYSHVLSGQDALPAASTTIAGLVQFDTADPQPNGTANPGSSGMAAQSDHVHTGSGGGGDVLSPVAGGDFFLKGSGVGDDDWDLLRAPTTTDTSSVALTSGGGAGILFNGSALLYGDPGLALWPAGNSIVDFWLNVDSNSASFFVSIGRTPHGNSGGTITWIVTDQPLGTIASTVPILSPVVFAFPQSVGAIDDGLVIKVTATTATSCTATLGTGGTNQSKINLPLPLVAAPALRMSNQVVFLNDNAAPTAAGQVLTSTSDNPIQAKWAAPVGGGLIVSTILTAKTGYTHTLNALTGAFRLRGRASGGGGGSAQADSDTTAAGAGGAAGGYFDTGLLAASAATITAITTGASVAGGGTGGSGINAGATGQDTVCTYNSITYTAKGGLGGAGGTAQTLITDSLCAPGGAGVQGTNGAINSSGLPGENGLVLSGGFGISGAGGGDGGGARRTSNGAGNGGSAYPTGGGGGGALMIESGTTNSGGASSAGYLIVDEYMTVTLPSS
ncbi:MAG: hypothetical protein WCE40_01030 [Polyangia bacterium]